MQRSNVARVYGGYDIACVLRCFHRKLRYQGMQASRTLRTLPVCGKTMGIFERNVFPVLFQYQTEALPHGESLQSFCVKNKVPYNIFQKWFKDTRKKVVEVQIDGAPVISHEKKQNLVINLNL